MSYSQITDIPRLDCAKTIKRSLVDCLSKYGNILFGLACLPRRGRHAGTNIHIRKSMVINLVISHLHMIQAHESMDKTHHITHHANWMVQKPSLMALRTSNICINPFSGTQDIHIFLEGSVCHNPLSFWIAFLELLTNQHTMIGPHSRYQYLH